MSMTITGIVAEYNPFHNGHQYQYRQIRKDSEHSKLIIVMSGNFVQRGGPAIYDKYTRTRAALNAGADLVIELPTAFATSSAEDFAAAAVALLDGLGIVGQICFGSECGDIEALQGLAGLFACEPEGYRCLLKEHISSGMSFPQARNAALSEWLSKNPLGRDAAPKSLQWPGLLSAPNNILGIEYLKALQRRGSPMKPITITRSGQSYHGQGLNCGFASAAGIRAKIAESEGARAEGWARIAADGVNTAADGVNTAADGANPSFPEIVLTQVPPAAAPLYQGAVPVFLDDCSLLLNERLLALQHQGVPFDTFADISDELAARIEQQRLDFAPFSERITSLKPKQYTYTRVSRGLLHLMLGIEKSAIARYRDVGYAPYARILGFRKESAPLLTAIKRASAIPLITKTTDARRNLAGLPLEMFLQDVYCAHLYQAIVHQKSGGTLRNEYTQPLVLV